MRNLLATLILLSSFSAFAMGEERNATNDSVMCQTELVKPPQTGSENDDGDGTTVDQV